MTLAGCERNLEGVLRGPSAALVTMTRRSVQDRLIRAHLRQTLIAQGELIPAAFLLCPNEGRMVEMARCAACGHCARLFVDEHTLTPLLTCDFRPEPGRAERAEGTLVSEALRREVFCLHPDADLRSCTTLFRRLGLERAPVIDDQGAPLGVVSKRDLAEEVRRVRASCAPVPPKERRARVHALLAAQSVGPLARPERTMLADTAALGRAAALILDSSQDEVIVVDALGRLVGVVSTDDILRFLAEEHPSPPSSRRAHLRAV